MKQVVKLGDQISDFNELVSMVNFLSRDDLFRLLYVALSRASKKVIVFIK